MGLMQSFSFFLLSENILIDFVFIFWNSSIGKGKYNTTWLKKKKTNKQTTRLIQN